MSAVLSSESAAYEINGANPAFVQRPNASRLADREALRRTWRCVLQCPGNAAKRDVRAMHMPNQHAARWALRSAT
jgi:hypothetical protein